MTIDEILAAMAAIVDATGGRALTAEEIAQYEALERDLMNARASEEVRARQNAYAAAAGPRPVNGTPALIAGGRKPDTLTAAFDNYLRTGIPNADMAGLRVTNAQTAGSDPAGGYMVPPEFRQKLVDVQKAFGGIAGEVDSFNTGTGSGIEYPSVDDTANSGQITAEGAAVSGGADLVFGTVNLGAFKYTSSGASNAPLKVSVELLQDAAFDVSGLIARKLGMRIARKQAVDWVTGTGTTLPFGIARAALTADSTLAAGNAITYLKLLEIETALDPAYEQNAKWAMNKASWQNIRAVLDSTGRALIQDTGTDGIGGRPVRRLLGYDVVIDQAFPTNTTLSAKWAVLGDLREAYVIRRVSNLVVVVNPYSSAASGQVEFTAWERADGNVQNRKAYALAAANAA
jgi:HK97 family phage major capsid protein